ncbi:MAG: sigma-54 interaction domain-containing protein [Bacillota bacterium]
MARTGTGLTMVKKHLPDILNSFFDGVYITDGRGVTLAVNRACSEMDGVSPGYVVGRSVYDLEREGIFRPSVTARVLQERKRVSLVQETARNLRVLVTGTPVFDETGTISLVVCNVRDITEITRLRNELTHKEMLVSRYHSELHRFMDTEARGLVYRSPGMQQLVEMAERVAGYDSIVLLQGESGVGKDLLANFIHRHSPRREGPFMAINCGAIPENLLESELFGYESGAFTGAKQKGKIGLIEAANGGTLFLNEISEIPLDMQVKLLQFLEARTVIRIGGTRPIPVNARILAATNKDLKGQVAAGRFREDLFYRLNVVPLFIPPLRERREDIPILVSYFLSQFAKRYGISKEILPEALSQLVRYSWPGNVRELQNVIERLLVTTPAQQICRHDVDQVIQVWDYPDTEEYSQSLDKAMEMFEGRIIRQYARVYPTTRELASALGISKSSAARKLRKYLNYVPKVVHEYQ